MATAILDVEIPCPRRSDDSGASAVVDALMQRVRQRALETDADAAVCRGLSRDSAEFLRQFTQLAGE